MLCLHDMSIASPAKMARTQSRSAYPRCTTITPSEFAVGAGCQRSCSSSRSSSLKIALSRKWVSQARAIAISPAGADSAGLATRSSGRPPLDACMPETVVGARMSTCSTS